MAARALTKQMYNDALDFYRENPGRITACARKLKITVEFARRLWRGPRYRVWPWAIPIQDVLSDKSEQVRAEQEHLEEQKRLQIAQEAERARKLAEEAVKFEEQALAVARADIIHGLASLNQLTRGVTRLAREVGAQLEQGVDAKGQPLKVDILKCLAILRGYTTSVKGLTDAAKTMVDLGRVQRDLPTQIVGMELTSMTLEDAQREVDFASKALERAKALGLEVHEGGLGA